MVDPEQTDPEQYATSEDEHSPEGVFPYGVVTDDGRVLWGVVPRRHLPVLLIRTPGGCYPFRALDGRDSSGRLVDAALEDPTGDGDSAAWKDAYTVEFGKEQET
jgi:hypothetical protein